MIGSRIDDRSRLPPEWSVAAVGQIGSYLNGHAFKPSQWTNEGLPIIRIQNLTDYTKPFNYFAGKVPDRYLIDSGDILVSWSASLGAFRWTRGKAWLNQHIFKATPNADVADWFFYYLMQHAIERIAKNARGSTMRHVTLKEFVQSEVALPPLREQRQIAAVLSATQWAIERQERLIALTAELKRALTRKLFTEGTRGEPLKRTETGAVPESWEIIRLDQIATIERGRFTHRPRNAPEFYGGDIPFVQTGDVSKCDGRVRSHTQTLNERGLAISRLFPRGTILITIAANIGYAGILEFDAACTDSLVAITPKRGDLAEFLNHYLQTQQPMMDQLAPRGTQKNINIQFLKPWPIPHPSIDEQGVISDVLNQVDLKRRTHERMRDSLSSLFRTLLHELMTAQVRVHDLDLSSLAEAGQEPAGAV
jgi:type I restriction enzyme, S subunit